MSIFSQRDFSEINVDTFHMLKESMDVSDPDLDIKTFTDRVLNKAYNWYIRNANSGIEDRYGISLYKLCPDGKYDNPRIQEFFKEMEGRGFKCELISGGIEFTW